MTMATAIKANTHVVKACIKDALRYLDDYELPTAEVTTHLLVRGYDAETITAALARASKERRLAQRNDQFWTRSLIS